jgi:hypothetical protein
MNKLEEMALRIIKEQELIIGPIARDEARHVAGLHLESDVASIEGDPKTVIDALVAQYERLFGRASREACRDAVASIIADLSPAEIPSSLVAA